MSDKIKFIDNDTKEEIEFTVIEQTRVNNTNYLLVTEEESDGDDEIAYILKDLSNDEDKESNYVIVDDDSEIDAVSKIFSELLDDVDIKK